MTQKTDLAKTILAAGDEPNLDKQSVNILKYKCILANIIHEVIPEFQGMSVNEVEAHIGRVEALSHPLDDNYAESSVNDVVEMKNTVSKSINDGDTYFDVYFDAFVDKENGRINLIVNTEIQNDFYPGYPIARRAGYYAARAITDQRGTVFKDQEYDKIRKVYSIWICPKASKETAGQVREIGLQEKPNKKLAPLPPETYQIMSIFIVYCCDPAVGCENTLADFCSTLFSAGLTAEERNAKLAEKYQIPEEIRKEVINMGVIGEAYLQTGIEQGMERGIEMGEERERNRNILATLKAGVSVPVVAQIFQQSEEAILDFCRKNNFSPA